MKPEEARAALQDVEAVKARLTQHTRWPLWRHLLAGFLLALLAAGPAFDNWVQWVLLVVAVALMPVVVWIDRRHFGMFVSGYQGSRTKRALAASIVLALGGLLSTSVLSLDPPLDPIFVAIVVAVFCGSTALSIWWEHLYRADLAARKDP